MTSLLNGTSRIRVTQQTSGNSHTLVGIELDLGTSALIERQYQEQINGSRFNLETDSKELMTIAGDILLGSLSDHAVSQIREVGSGRGAPILVISGLPSVSTPPATPIRGFGDDSKVTLADASLLAVFFAMGVSPIAFEFENYGRLVRNVVPNPDSKGVESSHGFDAELGWHTDNPCGGFEPEHRVTRHADRSPIPRFLGFSCLRNTDGTGIGVPTELLTVASIVANLDDQTLAVLGEPEFCINPPPSNACGSLNHVPILIPNRTGYFLRFNANDDQVFGVTDRAMHAIGELKLAMAECDSHDEIIPVDMQPGTILVFDNYRVCHRRRSFNPGFDWANARWLRRIFACRSELSGLFVDRRHWPSLWK